MGSKNKPGDFDCYANAHPDEPMFVLLGRDPCAPILVELWAKLRQKTGENIEKVAEAVSCALEMSVWASKLGKEEKIAAAIAALHDVMRELQPLPAEGLAPLEQRTEQVSNEIGLFAQQADVCELSTASITRSIVGASPTPNDDDRLRSLAFALQRERRETMAAFLSGNINKHLFEPNPNSNARPGAAEVASSSKEASSDWDGDCG